MMNRLQVPPTCRRLSRTDFLQSESSPTKSLPGPGYLFSWKYHLQRKFQAVLAEKVRSYAHRSASRQHPEPGRLEFKLFQALREPSVCQVVDLAAPDIHGLGAQVPHDTSGRDFLRLFPARDYRKVDDCTPHHGPCQIAVDGK